MDTDKPLIECWAEEGGIQVRIRAGDNDSRIIEIVNVCGAEGWAGKVLASATVASFRRQRLADALAMPKTEGDTG
jgi:hypothetical protein